MTGSDLHEKMHAATEDLYPLAPEQLLSRALVGGERRRARRRAGLGAASAGALGLAVTGVLTLTGVPGGETSHVPVAAQASGVPAPTSTYSPGSRTEVPEGPTIPTQRRIVDDATLKATVVDLIDGRVDQLKVIHVSGSGVGGHLADTTTDGRMMSFKVDGAGASIAVGRWDGYRAVGETQTKPYRRLVATTARQACRSAFQQWPANSCVQAPEGWYTVGHPSAGGAAGSKELWVDLFTHDGFVVRVHSLNTPAEKQGAPLQGDTALTESKSLALARSADWFKHE